MNPITEPFFSLLSHPAAPSAGFLRFGPHHATQVTLLSEHCRIPPCFRFGGCCLIPLLPAKRCYRGMVACLLSIEASYLCAVGVPVVTATD